jgi:hypothetical protein
MPDNVAWHAPVRRLDAGQIGAVFALHQSLVRSMAADLVARETQEFFASHMSAQGQIHGVFDADRLIAYAVLGLPRQGDPNFGLDHGLSGDELDRVAHLDGAGVDPQWRGNGLQRWLTLSRLAAARAAGRSTLLSTVAPANVASLASLLACGLQVRGLAQRFGGWRYLLRLDIEDARAAAGQGVWVERADLARQQALLEHGCWGWEVEPGLGRKLRFAPPLPSQPFKAQDRTSPL